MAFDARYLSCVLEELEKKCASARVEKIYQPSRDTLIFLLRCQQGREKLLIAANPTAPRLHLTAASPENPPEPPMFCMFLRKHLLGARLASVSQISMERAAFFTFDCTDEMGYPIRKTLAVELMGRTCNVYLLGPDGRILDCLRRVGLDETSRPALPGLHYQKPSKVEKQDPLTLEEADFEEILRSPGADLLSDRLMDTLGGLSPLVCREAALYALGATDARVSAGADTAGAKLLEFFRLPPAPYFWADHTGTPKQFAFCPIREYGDCQKAESFSGLLDRFYTLRDRKDAMRQKGQALRKTVTNHAQRLRRKIALPAGGVALLLLFFLPTPTGEALRFWVIRPLTRQDTVVTESDYSRFGIKRKIPDRDDVTALPGKNLVLVYLESTENSYLDEERFPNLMPNTRKLLEEAIVFEEIQPSEYATFTFRPPARRQARQRRRQSGRRQPPQLAARRTEKSGILPQLHEQRLAQFRRSGRDAL